MEVRLSNGDMAQLVRVVTAAGADAGAGTVTSGQTAHASPITGNPVRVGARAITADPTAVISGDAVDLKASTVGALAVTLNQVPELTWAYSAAAGGITDATAIAAKTAAAAGIRNYVTGLQVQNTNATATEFLVLDGATPLYRGYLPANQVDCVEVNFSTPLRGSPATALNIQCATTGAAVYANLQGFIAP